VVVVVLLVASKLVKTYSHVVAIVELPIVDEHEHVLGLVLAMLRFVVVFCMRIDRMLNLIVDTD